VPRGALQLVAGMYLPSTGERLPVLDADGQVIEEMVYLGEITVTGD
jgi:hypothetical protein